MKILIVGYQRSGTTMLRRLLIQHPEIQHIFHEKRIIKGIDSKQLLYQKFKQNKWFEGTNPDTVHWGDKVPFYCVEPMKMLGYCTKWLQMFKDDSRIVHVIRHPLSVAHSNIKSVSRCKVYDTHLHHYGILYPEVLKLSNANKLLRKNTFIISFESLVQDPFDSMTQMFKFLKMDHSKPTITKISNVKKSQMRYFDGINKDRAFAFKKEVDMNKITKEIPNYDKIRKFEMIKL